jgi:hypothetical protein
VTPKPEEPGEEVTPEEVAKKKGVKAGKKKATVEEEKAQQEEPHDDFKTNTDDSLEPHNTSRTPQKIAHHPNMPSDAEQEAEAEEEEEDAQKEENAEKAVEARGMAKPAKEETNVI